MLTAQFAEQTHDPSNGMSFFQFLEYRRSHMSCVNVLLFFHYPLPTLSVDVFLIGHSHSNQNFPCGPRLSPEQFHSSTTLMAKYAMPTQTF